MKVKSMRIPEDIEESIEYVSKKEKIEKAQSLRKLARVGFESYIAELYKDGKICLREASGLLKLSLSETIDLFIEKGIKGNIHANDVLESLHSSIKANPL